MDTLYEYTESQSFLVITVIIVTVILVIVGLSPLENEPVPIVWMVRGMAVIAPLILIALPRLRFKAFHDRIEATYGIGLIRVVIPNEKITSIKAIKYNPMMEFGGWGIRVGGGKRKGWVAYTAAITNKALAIETTDKNYIFGCPNLDEAVAILNNLIATRHKN
ncbi:MAG TPA: hypothetical protein ENN67_07200, partial [Firmicutes bacterium]|nr:hypothetical protein [Bacillota bacterium]